MFFLFTVCIQQIPDVSPTNKYTTVAPLAVVLLASAFKESQEDLVSTFLVFQDTVVTICHFYLSRNGINRTQNSMLA